MKSVLKLYDTATKEKREFVPLSPPRVKMYCCGPTVYDYLHIGNFRGAVFFNFVRNWLEFLNYEVDYIYNFTDVEDKILKRSAVEKMQPKDLAEKYIEEFKKDYNSLKLKPHTANPRATETLTEIIQLIQKLIDKGKAYEIEGDVFYSVHSFKDYGYLSGKKPDELLAGARVEIDKRKKNPLDFALWKKSKPEENWHFDSPWGKGRPGWHIECTAMIHKFLGEEIDIHAGGSDLIFPHHENEIAQSEACTNKKYVRFWLHNNMIVAGEGDKMSKSLGNILRMREFLDLYPGELFKFLILSCHYRSPLQFSEKTIHQALVSLSKIYSSLVKAQKLAAALNSDELASVKRNQWKDLKNNQAGQKISAQVLQFQEDLNKAEEDIDTAFNDDFATPKAFAVLFSVLNAFYKILEDKKNSSYGKSLCAARYLLMFNKYGELLSLFQEEPETFLKNLDERLLAQKKLKKEDIHQLVEKRSLARKNKDFKTADEIRKQLDQMGIEVRDSSQGSEWEVRK